MGTTEEQEFQSYAGLHSDITRWLRENRHIPAEDRLVSVAQAMKDIDPERLLYLAATSYLYLDASEETEAASDELESSSKSVEQAHRVTSILSDAFIRVTMDHLKSVKEKLKDANRTRGKKFKITENQLKQYWQDNIDTAKRATDAAILLERTDIYKNADPIPKRSTLEGYVRKWQALPQ